MHAAHAKHVYDSSRNVGGTNVDHDDLEQVGRVILVYERLDAGTNSLRFVARGHEDGEAQRGLVGGCCPVAGFKGRQVAPAAIIAAHEQPVQQQNAGSYVSKKHHAAAR